MGILDLLKIPIGKVTSGESGAYSSFNRGPIKLPTPEAVKIEAPTFSPLKSLAKPIGSVTPIQKATGAPKQAPRPQIDTSDPLSFLRAPIASVAPLGETRDVKVRKQEWKDVANMPTEVAGFLAGPAIDAFLSIREALTGERGKVEIKNPFPKQGEIPVDSPAPDWFKKELEKKNKQSLHPEVVEGTWMHYAEEHNRKLKGYSSETSQEFYIDQLDEGVDPKQAFWNTALKTVLDMSILVPVARDAGKLALLRTAPEKLIDTTLQKATRQELRDFVSGADKYRNAVSPLPEELQTAFKAATAEEKIAMIRGSGIEVATAKPSMLGRLVGVSEEEAGQLLEQMAGKSVREGSAGALPGYRRGERAPAFGLSTERREPVGFGDNLPSEFRPLLDDVKNVKVTSLKKAQAKFRSTGTAEILAGTKFGVAIKDEGDFISVRFGPRDLAPVGSVPSGEKNFATEEEAFAFAKEVQDTVLRAQAKAGDGRTLYHGTQATAFKQFEGTTYLTDDPKEALAFAEGVHLGGKTGGKPRVLEVDTELKKIKDINKQVEKALEDGDLDEVINREVEKAKQAGFDAVSFSHPSSYHEGEFTAYVPVENTKITIKEKKPEGEVTFEEKPYYGRKDMNGGGFLIMRDAQGKKLGQADFAMRGNRAVLPTIEIDETLRGKGLGSKLLEKVEQMAKERGATKITAQVVQAPEFFAKHGYEHATDGTTAMVKDLSKSPTLLKTERKPKIESRAKGEGSALEKELVEKYRSAGPARNNMGESRADEELLAIEIDMDLAKPRETVFISYGKDARVDMIASSFPKWIPEELRKKELFRKILPDLNNLKYPPARNKRQVALYDAILDELDARLGIDTMEIRSRIKAYEDTPQKGDAKTSGRSARGSAGGKVEKEVQAEKEVSPYDRPPFGPGSEEEELARKGVKISDEGIRMSTKDVEARIARREARKQERLDRQHEKELRADPEARATAKSTLRQLQATRRYQALRNKQEWGKEPTPERGSDRPRKKSPKDASSDDITTIHDIARGVKPPEMKNGVAISELNFFDWHDKGALALSRDTLERNIEKVVGEKDQPAVKEWLLDPIRVNETKRIKFANALRKETEEKIVKGLGIGRKTGVQRYGLVRKNILTELVQRYGEGNQGEFPLSLEELKRIEPNNWMRVKEAAEFFRGKYNMLLEMVNKERAKFGYEPIPARPDYFRHFREMDDYLRRFGLIMKKEDLPGELAGLTGIFRPGKPFSTAELKRKGKRTEIDAIAGFDNYINSITRQIFHIDSVQRGRALEKYMRETMKAVNAEAVGESEQLKLGNFANSIKETTNIVSGKKSDFDRAFESRFGRRIYAASDWLRQRTSANMVGANVASAMTNFAPFTQALATTEKKHFVRGLGEAMMLPAKQKPFEIDGAESSFLVRRYPIETIDPRGLRNAQQKAGWIFRGVDQFVSTAIVAGKYYENIAQGMTKEAAMKAADAYAGKMIADRSAGQQPLLLADKSLGFLTQFQLEVNNVWSFMVNDIPNLSGKNKLKYASMLAQFLIYSYLFNEGYKKATGRRPILDPIYILLTLAGMTDESAEATVPKRVILAGGDLAGNVPFIGGFTGGRFPIFSVLPDVPAALKDESSWAKEAMKIPMIVLPFGGLQAKKTYNGIDALIQGYTETTKGEKKAEIERTPSNIIKGTIFGPAGLKESVESNAILNDLYTRLDSQKRGSASLTRQAEKLDAELSAMSPEDADKKAEQIASTDPKLFERLEKVVAERELGLTQEERVIKRLNVEPRARYVDEMMRRMDPESADKYLNELIEKKVVTEKVLERLTEIVESGESAPAVTAGTKLKEESVIDRAVTYAKAIGTDPVTAFNRIFTGQSIRYVKNGTVVVERLPLDESEAEARAQLSATTTPGLVRGDVKLDHTIPLQLGGSNNKKNLRLVTTAEWEKFTPVENFLGEAVRDGKISKKKAQELIRRFKAGELSAERVYENVRE